MGSPSHRREPPVPSMHRSTTGLGANQKSSDHTADSPNPAYPKASSCPDADVRRGTDPNKKAPADRRGSVTRSLRPSHARARGVLSALSRLPPELTEPTTGLFRFYCVCRRAALPSVTRTRQWPLMVACRLSLNAARHDDGCGTPRNAPGRRCAATMRFSKPLARSLLSRSSRE